MATCAPRFLVLKKHKTHRGTKGPFFQGVRRRAKGKDMIVLYVRRATSLKKLQNHFKNIFNTSKLKHEIHIIL